MIVYCSCETPIMDVEHDAGCRRCGNPVDFGPAAALERHLAADPEFRSAPPVSLWREELTTLLRDRGVDLAADVELRDALYTWAAHYAEAYRAAAEAVKGEPGEHDAGCDDCGSTTRDGRGLLVHLPEYGCADPEADAYRRGYRAGSERMRERAGAHLAATR